MRTPLRPWLALLPAAIPVLALVAGLPFANRLEPAFFGMPFLLAWILAWVALTPVFLWIAYAILRRSAADGPGSDGDGGEASARDAVGGDDLPSDDSGDAR
jgi:hypothetical protein